MRMEPCTAQSLLNACPRALHSAPAPLQVCTWRARAGRAAARRSVERPACL